MCTKSENKRLWHIRHFHIGSGVCVCEWVCMCVHAMKMGRAKEGAHCSYSSLNFVCKCPRTMYCVHSIDRHTYPYQLANNELHQMKVSHFKIWRWKTNCIHFAHRNRPIETENANANGNGNEREWNANTPNEQWPLIYFISILLCCFYVRLV